MFRPLSTPLAVHPTGKHFDEMGNLGGNGPPFRRVTLTVTVRVSRVSVMVSVRDSVK